MHRTTALVTAATTLTTAALVGVAACDRPRPRTAPPDADAGVVVRRWADDATVFVSVKLDDGRRVTRALDHADLCPPGSKYPVCDA